MTAPLAIPESAKIVLDIIVAAAERGERCPTNAVLSTAIGGHSTSKAANAVTLLETIGVITVQRGSDNRVVTITSSGKRTAGKVSGKCWQLRASKGTVAYRNTRWNENRDAILMQRIADGADFEQASILCGCSPEQAAARFDALADRMGWQAA